MSNYRRKIKEPTQFTVYLGEEYKNRVVVFSINENLIIVKKQCRVNNDFPFLMRCSHRGRLYLGGYVHKISWVFDYKNYYINEIDDMTIHITPFDPNRIQIDTHVDDLIKLEISPEGKVLIPKEHLQPLEITNGNIITTTIQRENDYLCLIVEKHNEQSLLPTYAEVKQNYGEYLYMVNGLKYKSEYQFKYRLGEPYLEIYDHDFPVLCMLDRNRKCLLLYLAIPEYNAFSEVSHLFANEADRKVG